MLPLILNLSKLFKNHWDLRAEYDLQIPAMAGVLIRLKP
jgi:hypothetical protein